MKKVLLLSAVAAALTFASCSTTNKGYQSSRVDITDVQLDPLKADLTIDESRKLTGTSQFAYFFIFKLRGDNTFADGIRYNTTSLSFGAVNQAKSAAAYKALSQGDYDVLVSPQYSVSVKSGFFKKTITVTVEGYGGKYSNFRTERQKTVIFDNGKEIILQDR